MENNIKHTKSNETKSSHLKIEKYNSYNKTRRKKISFKQIEEKNKIEYHEPNNKKESSIISKELMINKRNSIHEEIERPSSFTKLNKNILLTKSPKKRLYNSPQLKLRKNKFEDNEDSQIHIFKKRSNNIPRKKNKDFEFSFLEQPEFYNNTQIMYSKQKRKKKYSDDDDDNISLLSLSGLTNQSIIKLNEIQKEFRKTIIGNTKIMEINNNGKTYLMEDNNEDKENDDNNSSSEEEEENNYEKENYRLLQNLGKIYDSLDEEDISINDYYYIDPDNQFIRILDFLTAIFTIYNLIYIPFFLGYNDIYCRNGKFLNFLEIIDIINDIIYIIDNIIPFFLALRINEQLQTDLKEIRKNYLKQYFLIDFLAAIPFHILFSIFDNKCNDIGYLSAPLYQNNLYYILITLQLPKAIKVFRQNYLIQKIKDYLNQYEHFNIYLGLYESISIFLIGIHIVSCIFIFIGKNQYPGWIIHYNFQDKNFFGLYFIAIYYIITTVTTVGYGDLLCITPIEKVFGLFMEIVGIVAYSFALTSISNYVKVLSDKNEEYHQKCEMLNDIRNSFPDLSDDLYKRIHCFLRNNLFHNKIDKKIIINSLPVALKNNLVYHMYEGIINHFIFFKNFNNTDFIVRVILSFKPILAIKNDILIKDGDFVHDIIFIKFGRLSLDLPIIFEKEISKPNNSIKESNNHDSTKNNLDNLLEEEEEEEEEEEKIFEETVQYFKILELQKNEHFGDTLMFLNKRCSLRLKVKSRKAELFYLSKNDALEISTSYPLIWKKINKKSLFNWEQIKRLMNKVYKIFYRYHGDFNDEQQPVFTNSVIEYTDLQSIPSLTEITLDEDERTQLKMEKKMLHENTKKNKEMSTIKILKTIKESKTYEDKNDSMVNNSNNNSNSNNNNNNTSSNNNNHNYNNHNNHNNNNNHSKHHNHNDNYLNYHHNENYLNYHHNDNYLNYHQNNYLNIRKNSDSEKKSDITEKSLVTKRLSVLVNNEDEEESEDVDLNKISVKSAIKIDDLNERKKIEFNEKNSYQNSNITPYKPNEINNEIYPFETFVVNNINNDNNDLNVNYSLLKSKINSNYNDNNNSVCSTEISFSIESEYENINEMSNYIYSKNEVLKMKIKNILTEVINVEGTIKSNLKNKNKGVIHIKNNPSVKFLGFKTNQTINNSFISNRSKLNEGSFVSKKKKSNLSINSCLSCNSNNDKKRKKKNLLNEIHQNIERNYMDLNDPNLFYSEFFQHYFDKSIKNKKKKNNKPNLFSELDDELIKKFEINDKNNPKITPLKKFNEMLKKI